MPRRRWLATHSSDVNTSCACHECSLGVRKLNCAKPQSRSIGQSCGVMIKHASGQESFYITRGAQMVRQTSKNRATTTAGSQSAAHPTLKITGA
eukprot:2978950-Amphidinium_carterae.1